MRHKLIMLIVDDAKRRAILADKLHHCGFGTVEVASSADALRVLTTIVADVAIIDLERGALEVDAFLDARTRSAALRAVPVIVVSNTPPLPAHLAFGAARVLAKPHSDAALLDAIDQLLGPPPS